MSVLYYDIYTSSGVLRGCAGLRWCEEFYWVALAWICGLTFCTGLTKFTLYSYDYGHDHSIHFYLVLACMYVGTALFVAAFELSGLSKAFGVVGAVRSFRGCRGCPELLRLLGLL